MSNATENALGIKANIVWNTVGNFFYLFSQWLLTYLVVRILGYQDAGILSLATSICGSLVSLSLYGMRSFQVSDIVGQYSDGAYILSRIVTSFCAFIVCLGFVLVNGYTFFLSACVLVYMGFKISESVSDVYQGILQKKMRMDYIGKSFLIKSILSLVAFFTVLVLTKNLLAALIAMTFISVGIVFFYDRTKAKLLSPGSWRVKLLASKPLLVECLPLALFSFLFNSLTLMPRYLLEMAVGTEALGIYASIAMPVVIVQVSASYIFAPLTTPFAEYYSKRDIKGFMLLVKRIVLFIVILSVVSLVGFAVVGEWALVLLFGDSMIPYTYLLMPLVVCTILVALSWFLSTLLTVIRKLKSLLAISIVSFFLVMFGGIPCINIFGINGASIVLIIGLLTYSGLAAMVIGRSIYMEKKLQNEVDE